VKSKLSPSVARIDAASPITKQELLSRLDKITHSVDSLKSLQECLADSNQVSVVVANDSIVVSVQDLGVKFLWKIDDPRTAVACLAVSGVYEPLETHVLGLASSEATHVVDVGANIGYYSTVLPLMNKSIKKVYAFEPMPIANSQLNTNILLNSLSNRVISFAIGISNELGTLRFYLPDLFGTSATSSAVLHPEVNNTEIQVSTSSLDILFKDGEISGCDLLKIDVEGAEKFVLEGSLELIEACEPVIFTELLRKWSKVHGYHPNEVVGMLKSHGYKCWGVSAQMPQVDEISDETIETNFIFLKTTKISHQDLMSTLGLK
jgi:FkbM family methyltransferase